jgi:hypothetical protein
MVGISFVRSCWAEPERLHRTSALELPQNEKALVVSSQSARSKMLECREQTLCHGSRRIDRHISDDLHQPICSEHVTLRITRFRDSVRIHDQDIVPIELHGHLNVVGARNQSEWNSLDGPREGCQSLRGTRVLPGARRW